MNKKICWCLLSISVACGKGNHLPSASLPIIKPEPHVQSSTNPVKASVFSLTAPATLKTSFQNSEGKSWSLSFNSLTFAEIRKDFSSKLISLFQQEKLAEINRLVDFMPLFSFETEAFFNLKLQAQSILDNDDQANFAEVELVVSGIKNLGQKKLTVYNFTKGTFNDLPTRLSIVSNNLVIRTSNIKQLISLMDENSIIGLRDTNLISNDAAAVVVWDGVNLERFPKSNNSLNEMISSIDAEAIFENDRLVKFKNIYTDDANARWEIGTKNNVSMIAYCPIVLTSQVIEESKKFEMNSISNENKKINLKQVLALSRGDEVVIELSQISFFVPRISESKSGIDNVGSFQILRKFDGYIELANHQTWILEGYHFSIVDISDKLVKSMVVYKYKNGEKTQIVDKVTLSFPVNKILSDFPEIQLQLGTQKNTIINGYERHRMGNIDYADEFVIQNKSQFKMELKVKRKFN